MILRFKCICIDLRLTAAPLVEQNLQCAYVTASKTVEQFVEFGLLKEITGWQRNRLYRYEPYLILFQPLQSVTPQDFGNNK